jgi:hypothetical protein
MDKEQEDAHRTWNVVTYLVTLILAGVAYTTAGIQWGLGSMKNVLVRALFEPIWSIIVLPLFFMSTVVWDFARFLVESTDLQESVKKGKRSPNDCDSNRLEPDNDEPHGSQCFSSSSALGKL